LEEKAAVPELTGRVPTFVDTFEELTAFMVGVPV
jgi:hypothetical protein